MDLFFSLGITLSLILFGYFVGSMREKNHYKNIRKEEAFFKNFVAVTFEKYPSDWKPQYTGLVTGSVVISVDYFKRFLAGLRSFVGGRITSYETLMDRARREAIIRMKKYARSRGYNAIINIRLETARLAGGGQNGKGIAGVEILAYGTGMTFLKAKNATQPKITG